jgi:hypothetical protein
MKKIIYLLIVVGLITILGCAADDEKDKDTTAPNKPELIPHLGDTGDGLVEYQSDTFTLTDDNNGIDAYSAEDGFRIMWKKPIYDDDLEKVVIYRFMNRNTNDIVKVDSLSAASDEVTVYFDRSMDDNVIHENLFSYFIELFDESGNSTLSDTVSYKIAKKPHAIAPYSGEIVSGSSNLTFKLGNVDSMFTYRIILFTEDLTYINHWDRNVDIINDNTSGNEVEFDYHDDLLGAVLPAGNYAWRVDVRKFSADSEFEYYGGESYTNTFSID